MKLHCVNYLGLYICRIVKNGKQVANLKLSVLK